MKFWLSLGLTYLLYNHTSLAQEGRIVFPKKDHFITTNSLLELRPKLENFTSTDFRLLNQPQRASFDVTTGNFSWRPSKEELGAHFLTFIATDTANVQISQVVYVKVEEPKYAPKISFLEKNFNDSEQPIEVRERLDTVRFRVQALDKNDRDQVRYQFTVNGRSTPALKHYTLEILNDILLFEWIPCNEAAKEKSFRIEIEAFDNSGLSDQMSLSFLVEDFNFPPEILNQRLNYEILPGETTAINIRAKDWDDDPLEYRLLTPGLSNSYFKLDELNGLLTVNVPARDIQNTVNGSLSLTIRAQEIKDPSKYVDITFQLKQAATNIAPEITISKTVFEIQEGREFSYLFQVFDANGNQNLTARLRNAPEGLSVNQTADGSYELKWSVDFDYLKTYARGEDKRSFETELIATDGLLDSSPKTLQFVIINQEDPNVLRNDFFRWKSQTAKFITSMNYKSTVLDKKAVNRGRSNKWLGFLAASVGAFGGLSAATKDGSALNNAAPFWVFSSAVVTGYVALRTPPSEYSIIANELKRMQTELKSTQDALDRLSAERLDKTFKGELGKAVDLLKKSTNTWVIQFYPKYSELMYIQGPEVEFSKDRESSVTFTK